MTRKRVLLAALTAAFVAGNVGVALAQAGGGGAGNGGAAAGGGNSCASGAAGNGSVGSGNQNNPSPYYKDERYPHR